MTDLIRKSDALAAAQDASDNSDEPQDVVSAIAALPAVTVGLRHLVWEAVNEDGRIQDAVGYNSVYRVWLSSDRIARWRSKFMGEWLVVADLAAAKAAAQADYEARILAALEPVAAPAQCCMCGKRDLSTEEDGGPECQMNDGRWVCSRECYGTACALLEPVAAPDPAAIREAIWSAFIAGCGQGSDEATSFEWGSTAQQTRQQAFDDFMAEWNKDSAPLRALISKGAAEPTEYERKVAQMKKDFPNGI